MKTRKTLSKLLLFVLMFALALSIAACDDDDTGKGGGGTQEVAEITLDKTTATIFVGDDLDYSDFTITVKYKDSSKKDETYTLTEAMITDGLSLLGQVGTHELTVTVMGKTAKLTVTVNAHTMEGVAMQDVTKTYDGNPAALTLSGLPIGAQVKYTYYKGETADESKKVDSIVDAGTYLAKAVISAPGYADKELTAKVVVNKATFDTSKLSWSNTVYAYTGEEITLAATAQGLPDGITVKSFTDDSDAPAKATETGTYSATVTFENTNPNYEISSCSLSWKIFEVAQPMEQATWQSVYDSKIIEVTFAKGEGNALTLTFGEDTVNGVLTYDFDQNQMMTSIQNPAYTSVVSNGFVLTIVKSGVTYKFLQVSQGDTMLDFSHFVGEFSTIAEEFDIVLDTTAKTLKLTTALKGETAVEQSVYMDLDSSDNIQLKTAGDLAITYDSDAARVKLDGYANPADFNQVASSGIYLLTKEEAQALVANMASGSYTDYSGNHYFTVAADKSVEYDGKSVQMYATYYVATSSYYTSGAKLYASISTNKRNVEVTVYDGYYSLYISYSNAMYVPADYKNFFGTYYPRTETGFDTSSAKKVSFMEHEGYFRIYVGSTGYEVPKDEISFSLTGGVLTATLTKEGADAITATFEGTTVTIGETTYSKTKTLFSTSSSTWFYNIANNKYIKDNGNGSVTIYGTEYKYKSLEYTANGLEITVTVDGTDKVIVYSGDSRYITYDGVVHVSDSITSVSNGRVNATYYNGENSVSVANGKYTLNIGGTSADLENPVYSIVDDGNNNGRTIIQVTGKIGDTDYTIKHYSLAALLVNGTAYAHSTFVDIMGSEFKPTVDSDDVFKFAESGKMTFRGTEIFLNGASSYTNFYFTDNYYYSFDISKTSISFNDQIIWNTKYYFTAYFDFSGAYISEDQTKVFVFDANTVYYNGTSTTSFKAKETATGAMVTISSKDAVFTKVAGGAHTLVYDGVTYTKATNFDLSSYYGTFTGYDGSAAGVSITFGESTSIQKFVMFNGEIAPVVSVSYNSFYLIKNKDAATSAQLPVLAIQDRFVTLPASTTFNGKTLTIQVKAVPKASSTEYIAIVEVAYDGKTSSLNYQYGTYWIEIDDVEYILQTNNDDATKEQLPILVFEKWWDDIDGTYTYNGRTLKIEIVADASNAQAPKAALKFTFDDEVVTGTIESVTGGGRMLTFAKDGVNYKGIIGGTPAVAVYTEAEYSFFFAASNTVNSKALVLSVKPTSSAVDFNLDSSTYDGKVLTFAKYDAVSGVLMFATEDGDFACDIESKQLWSDIMDFDASLVGISLTNSSTISGYNTSGSDLYYSDFKTVLGTFDKTTGKVALAATMGWNKNYPATLTKIDNNTFKVEGKNYNGKEITAYLILDGSTQKLITAEEYAFAGTYTVNGKSLVIAKSGTSYTASYDDSTAVAVTPDFGKRNFLMNTETKAYVVSWTYTTDFTFTVTEVSATAMKFVGSSAAAAIAYTDQFFDEITISYTGNDANGKAQYSIHWEKGYSSGNTTGTLNGNHIEVADNMAYNKYWIFLNNNPDDELKYVMIYYSFSAGNLIGEFDMGTSKVNIAVDCTPTYDYDDEYVVNFEQTKFVVTLDGKACTVSTKWSYSATKVEFTCEGKTYTATYASGSVTVEEKAA